MTGEFSTYECEELMGCGEPCVRLFGHAGGHECEANRAMRLARKFLVSRTPEEISQTDEEFLRLVQEQPHPQADKEAQI